MQLLIKSLWFIYCFIFVYWVLCGSERLASLINTLIERKQTELELVTAIKTGLLKSPKWSIQAFFIALLTTFLLSIFVWKQINFSAPHAWVLAAEISFLISLGWIDYRSGYLPDFLIWLLLICQFIDFTFAPQEAASILFRLGFWAAVLVLKMLVDFLSGKESMGWGDLKLMLALFVGVKSATAAVHLLGLASMTALIVAMFFKDYYTPHQSNTKPEQPLAFGPFLILSFIFIQGLS